MTFLTTVCTCGYLQNKPVSRQTPANAVIRSMTSTAKRMNWARRLEGYPASAQELASTLAEGLYKVCPSLRSVENRFAGGAKSDAVYSCKGCRACVEAYSV